MSIIQFLFDPRLWHIRIIYKKEIRKLKLAYDYIKKLKITTIINIKNLI